MSATLSFATHDDVRARGGAARGGLRRIGRAVAFVWRAMNSRNDLLELDDRMLSDLGISRAQANYEASRPLWRTGLQRR